MPAPACMISKDPVSCMNSCVCHISFEVGMLWQKLMASCISQHALGIARHEG